MQLISKLNEGFSFLFCLIDIFSKYARVVPLKDKNGISIVNAFQKILNDSASSEAKSKGHRQSQSKGRKPNKIWVDKGSEFYNNSLKIGEKIMTLKCIQYITKENLLLLKGSLEL